MNNNEYLATLVRAQVIQESIAKGGIFVAMQYKDELLSLSAQIVSEGLERLKVELKAVKKAEVAV